MYDIPGFCEYPQLQQSGRECDPALGGKQKDLLFCNSIKVAESSAIVYSFAETAIANGVEPYEHLILVLPMLPYLEKSPAHEELEKQMSCHLAGTIFGNE